MLNVDVHAASIQDRDGAENLLRQARRRFPFIERIIGDGGYAGPRMTAVVARTGAWTLEIVKRADANRFVVLPNAGSSSEPWPGSAVIDACREITSDTPASLPPSSGLP